MDGMKGIEHVLDKYVICFVSRLHPTIPIILVIIQSYNDADRIMNINTLYVLSTHHLGQ